VKYDVAIPELALPDGVVCSKTEDGIELSYMPSKLPTAKLLSILQDAGNISELTLQPENTDHLIAAMYKELDL
jgi:ABC-2 type transport system ATP-binding protein